MSKPGKAALSLLGSIEAKNLAASFTGVYKGSSEKVIVMICFTQILYITSYLTDK